MYITSVVIDVVCPVLPEPSNGMITYSGTTPVTATYSCDDEYGLSGESVITCSGGDWSATPSTCTGAWLTF